MDKFRIAIGGVVTLVWSVSYFADILMPKYEPPVGVHAVMMIVAGALFGSGIFRREGNGK